MLFNKVWGPGEAMFYNAISYADQCDNGDYFLVGTKTVGPTYGMFAFYACRMDSTGTILWEKTWSGIDNETAVSKLIKSFDDSYLIVGSGGEGGGVSNVMVSEIDQYGNVSFCEYIYNLGYDDYGVDVTPTQDSCYILCGVRGMGVSDGCPAFIKVDREGNEIWRRSYTSYVNYWPPHIAETPDSGFVVVGWRGNEDSLYAKYDKDGQQQWMNFPFGMTDTILDQPGSIRANADGTIDIMYRAVFQTGNPPSEVTACLQHCDAQGDTLWSKYYFDFPVFPQQTNMHDSRFCVVSTSNGYYEMDESYNFVQRVASGPFAYDYIATRDGGYLSFGTLFDPSLACHRFQVTKFAPDGRYQSEPFLSLLTVSPNPVFNGITTVSFDVQADEQIQVRVIGMDGRLVYYDDIFCPANSHTELPVHFDAATTTAGIYLLEVKSDGEYRRERIIVGRK